MAEPYNSVQVRTGALQAVSYSGNPCGNRVPRAGRLAPSGTVVRRHEEAVGRVGTTTRGYLQLWAMNWEG